VIAKVGPLAALLLTVSSARAENEVVDQVETPPVVEAVPSSDDLLRATGLRPLTRDRLEAVVGAGTEGAADAQLRATTKSVEVTADVHDSDLRERRGATARVERGNTRAFGTVGTLEQGTDEASNARYGASWRRGRFAAQVFGDVEHVRVDRLAHRYDVPTSTHGAATSLRSGRLDLLGLDHELVVGANYESSAGATTMTEEAITAMPMSALRKTRRGDHRYFQAYVKDTLHVIETLDLSGGFIIEDWRSLSAIETIHYGIDQSMDVNYPDVSDMQISPKLGATYRVDDGLAVRADGYRRMRKPTLSELYQPIALDGTLTAANPTLRPESVWGGEVGPELRTTKVEARAVAFYNVVDSAITSVATSDGHERANAGRAHVTGVETEASWRPAKAWLATVSYTFAHSVMADGKALAQAPRQRASAQLTFDSPRLVSVTGALRYVGRQYVDTSNTSSLGAFTLVDAIAARKLKRGIAGFVAVENLLDRSYVGQYGVDTQGAPRTFRVGVRVDSARF
jgi:outer membrane receptor protein involved in Fe transport